MKNPNDPSPKKEQVQWGSLFIGLAFPLSVGFLGFAGFLFVYQMEYNQWDRLPKTDYRYISPELIAYRQTLIFKCPVIGDPSCFAVQDESTFIVGTVDPPALFFFDERGMLLKKIGMPEKPRAVACGTLETIFTDKIVVAHPQHIAVYTAEGNKVMSWKLPGSQGGESDVRSLTLTPDYLFTADTGMRCVHRFNADGNLDLTFGNFVVYASPIVMTFSPQNNLLYIANPGKHRIEVFTQDGMYQPELNWGEPSSELSGFAGCCNPIALAVLDDGRVLTVEKAVSRIKIFQDRHFDCVVAGWDVLENFPQEFGRLPMKPVSRYFTAVHWSEGRIAVFDFDYAVIRVFSPL